MRSGVLATLRLPHCFQPVARPVSCSERRVELDPVLAHARRVARRRASARRGPPHAMWCRTSACPVRAATTSRDAELGQVIGGRRAGDAAADDRRHARRAMGKIVMRGSGRLERCDANARRVAAPARRASPKPSLSQSAPISAANITDVSRSAAHRGDGCARHRPEHDAIARPRCRSRRRVRAAIACEHVTCRPCAPRHADPRQEDECLRGRSATAT